MNDLWEKDAETSSSDIFFVDLFSNEIYNDHLITVSLHLPSVSQLHVLWVGKCITIYCMLIIEFVNQTIETHNNTIITTKR